MRAVTDEIEPEGPQEKPPPEAREFLEQLNRAIMSPPAKPNTFERAAEMDRLLCDELAAHDPECGPWAGAINVLINYYKEFNTSNPGHACPYPEAGVHTDNPLQYLADCVRKGYYPPPGALWAVMEAAEKYYNAAGEISLDEAFFGRPHSARGAASRQHATDLFYLHFQQKEATHRRLAALRGEAELTQPQLAEEYLVLASSHDTPPDLDTFLRNYRRWKKRLGNTHHK